MADLSEFSPVYKNEPNLFLPSRDEFLASYRNQRFSLPSSIIYYIAKNPSKPKIYQKMVKCCKHFFIRNPILVHDCLYLNIESAPIICFHKNSTTKLWITNEFTVPAPRVHTQCLYNLLIPRIYKPAPHLLLNDISMNFDDLVFLTSSAAFIALNNVSIKYSNGDEVEFEKVVEVCSNARIFHYTFSPNPTNISTKITKNLIKIPNFTAMKRIYFYEIPQTFDIKTLIAFLKKTDFVISLRFCASLSENYSTQLYDIASEIISTNAFIYRTPIIFIPGIDQEIQFALHRKAGII